MIRLGVNVDHVATVRQARGELYPDPAQIAVLAELGGADNITFHLREDRRHIQDRDVEAFQQTVHIPLNFEMAATPEMIALARRIKPHSVTLVPEKRRELTTEGGLDVSGNTDTLRAAVGELSQAGILVSLFVGHDARSLEISHELGAEAVEIHTGDFCRRMAEARTTRAQWELVQPLIEASRQGHEMGLQMHFGHGLNFYNSHWLQAVPYAEEANIGHAIVARALFVGFTQAVRDMKALLCDPTFAPVMMGDLR